MSEDLKDIIELKDEIIDSQNQMIESMQSQFIVMYPPGESTLIKEDGTVERVDNAKIAMDVTDKLGAGNSITLPNTWSVIVLKEVEAKSG